MLYIYRASAGSGKTFLLTGFYIELLFRKELTPSLEGRNLLFSEILAVTFTNKATAEMKERIIKDLNKLWKTPQASPYYQIVRGTGKDLMSDEAISNRAHEILKGMLTDYSNLHISTIDSFFQQVVRSFAHELNVQGNYEVELDANMVLDHAVTQFLLNLDPKRDKETFDWLLRFSNNRMENGSNWNVHKELAKLAKVLTTEAYRNYSSNIQEFSSNKEAMASYVKELDESIDNWRKQLKQTGGEIAELLKAKKLQASDFSRSSIACAIEWKNGDEKCTDTIRKWAVDTKLWFSQKKADKLRTMGEAATTLQGLLQQGVALFDNPIRRQYNSAVAIRKNIYQLGLLSRLEQVANEYCAEQGIKLLSDTTQMLNALISGQSAPFIYEKTGTRIASYMIDEFQDTSGMQWCNFSPLLRDSLGTNNRNLIVGDVKQSIYRWRGSDWNLLHSELNKFEPEMQDVDDNNNELRDNWRSDRKIIRFNNEFFQYASHCFRSDDATDGQLSTIEDIYADVAQTISADRIKLYNSKGLSDVPEGKVAFEILPGAEGKKEYKESVIRRLPELVIALQQQGRKAEDILILCRKRNQCDLCAKALLDYEAAHPASIYSMKIITQEALLLIKHPIIRAFCAVLEYLHEPKSNYRRSVADICWLSLSCESTDQAIETYYSQPDRRTNFDTLLNLPLYEIVERLIALLPADCRLETNFIQAFSDVVLQFCAKEGPNLDSFLMWWRENGHKCSVTTPSNQSAIRIMTIHQSKGLSGKAVIVPFAMESVDLKINGLNPDILWCEPKEGKFAHNNLVLPIEVNSRMENSIFSEDYNQERVRTIIDNLNTAYVAFTRAENELIILSPTPSDKANASLQYFLKDFFDNHWKSGNDKINIIAEDTETKVSSDNNYGKEVKCEQNATVAKAQVHLPRIKETEYSSEPSQNRGITLHDALSAVIDNTQVDEPITELFQSGRKALKGLTLAEVLDLVHKALQMPEAEQWFNPANRVFNEQDIIGKDTHTHRPDRIVITPAGDCIVIDYKTGERTGENDEKYKKQVSSYMSLLQEMGFSRIKGFIWYVLKEEIIPVKIKPNNCSSKSLK